LSADVSVADPAVQKKASAQLSGDVTLDVDQVSRQPVFVLCCFLLFSFFFFLQVAFAAFVDKCGYKDRVGEFTVILFWV